jgi:cytochrome bd-type quinol oxidase subunit 2
LPALGNLVLHLIYGFVLGQLYDASADAPAIAEDLTYDEPLEREAVAHSEAFGAAGIVGGIIVGALVGAGLGLVLPPGTRESSTGWSIALAIGGMLAGGGIGAIVGSFAGLPSAPRDPAEHSMGPDPFERTVLPFLLVPALVLVVVGIIVGLGSLLLSIAAMEAAANPQERAKLWPVYAALVATVLIGLGAWALSHRQESRSSGDTVSHGGR